jgi:hypothetical protein
MYGRQDRCESDQQVKRSFAGSFNTFTCQSRDEMHLGSSAMHNDVDFYTVYYKSMIKFRRKDSIQFNNSNNLHYMDRDYKVTL